MPKPKKVIGPSGRSINVDGPTWNKLSESEKKKALSGGFSKAVPAKKATKKVVKKASPKSPKSPVKTSQKKDSEKFVYVLVVTGLDPEGNLIVFKNLATMKEYILDPRRGRMPLQMLEDALNKFNFDKMRYSVELGSYIIFKAPVIGEYPIYKYQNPEKAHPWIKIL